MRVGIADDFDLNRIAESGQCFRWKPIDRDAYRIIFRQNVLSIRKISETYYDVDCTPEVWSRIWQNYFDLSESYGSIRAMICRETDPFLYRAAQHEKGIRILCQDPWEMMVTSILTQNRNIPMIQRSIELLCAVAGNRLPGTETMYAFPEPEALLACNEEALRQCKLGYRWKYIHALAQDVVEKRINLNAFPALSDEQLHHELMKIYGAGPKVVNCMMLFAFHRLNAFPVDVWIQRVLQQWYPEGYPFESYTPYNGVMQQYMFAYIKHISETHGEEQIMRSEPAEGEK